LHHHIMIRREAISCSNIAKLIDPSIHPPRI
jgi:hypothetical protein